MRSVVFFLVFFISAGAVSLTAQVENDGPEQKRYLVEVLTVGPGPSISSVWGHTALRIKDYRKGSDLVYDYGHFRFTSTFIADILTGQAYYWLGRRSYNSFLNKYNRLKRRVISQRITVADERVDLLVERLEKNMLPANRKYLYDSLKDNCTTRIRDAVNFLTAGGLEYLKKQKSDETFRTLSDSMLQAYPQFHLAVNLVYNHRSDAPISRWQALFLPQRLLQTLNKAASKEPAIGRSVNVLLFKNTPDPGSSGTFRWVIAFLSVFIIWALFFLLPALLIKFRPGKARLLQRLHYTGVIVVSLVATIAGGVMLSLWQAPFDYYRGNFNLLVFNPLWLIYLYAFKPAAQPGRAFMALSFLPILMTLAHYLLILIYDQQAAVYTAIAFLMQSGIMISAYYLYRGKYNVLFNSRRN